MGPADRRRVAGGIRSLLRLLTEHGEAVEADLARFYQVDLADLFRNRLSLRRLGVLVHHLPAESHTMTALRVAAGDEPSTVDPAKAPWSKLEMLLALVADHLSTLTWLYVSANSKEKPPRPEPILRPGVKPQAVRALSEQAVAYLERLRRRE